MKKSLLILACISLSACYYTAPAADYYYDDIYDEPDYYSQTSTYITPSSSYFYMTEQRTYLQPEIVYIDDRPHHRHYSPQPHYYYPKNNHSRHDKKHFDYKPHNSIPHFYKNEKITKIEEGKNSHLKNNRHNDKHKK
ncbi:MAG: hypothetical protein IJ677_07255 [Alphaproteobacteria bacterium]|nr:hypothetical protein [Alphaproteobacteria bacterium]